MNIKENFKKGAKAVLRFVSENKGMLLSLGFMAVNAHLASANAIDGLPVTDALSKVQGTFQQYIVPAVGTLGLGSMALGVSMNSDNQVLKKGLTYTGGAGVAYGAYDVASELFGSPTSSCLIFM